MTTQQNNLISKLQRTKQAAFLKLCEPVQLVLGQVLCSPTLKLRYVYFPVDGFISLIANVDRHPGLEVGMIGREGMLGADVALGVFDGPLEAVVQGAGSAMRISVAVFTKEISRNAALRSLMLRYVSVLMAQLALSCGCVRYHVVGPRLAKWLLMSQDRAHADRFPLTQAFLAYMLGVRRVSITDAAGILQRQGLIDYRRGEMTIVDRPGLEKAACSCYELDQTTYKIRIDVHKRLGRT